MKGYVKVLFPVEVPDSPYCWEHSSTLTTPICSAFDNEGGHSFCTLFNESLKNIVKGVQKLGRCAKMEKAPLINLSTFLNK